MSILHAWHSVGKFTVVYKVHICYAMTTIFVACVCLAFNSLIVYCKLGYSGKWHHCSAENSLWCIECRFTMQWQQYLLPVSYSLFKTLPYVHCPYSVLMLSLWCPYFKKKLFSKHTSSAVQCYWCEPYMTDASPYVSNLHRHERFILTRHFKTRYFNSLFSNETRYSWKNRVFLHGIIL